ncbi:integrin alpha-6b isoform X2 [Cynoglossus semilaevis]|uniref:Integrin, alpha 6b n=1 Tax=Cynoglossus semilaevis TaxID=244447 RepID=A0A3P8W5H9_CYNSE|nr:integrin alpha-6 isoform X2 [Cynoglossus semilaevis]
MDSRLTCGPWLLVVLLMGCGRLWGFNLDTDNVLRKTGTEGSLFGFSLAMHRQLKPVDKRMLLVGAPRAAAIRGQKSTVTGGLFSCDMSSSAPCTRVNFDNDEDLKRESKQNQWMGVTVSSQGPGGKVMTCAHRYQRRTNVNTTIESRDIIGRCYVLSEHLEIDSLASEDGGTWHFCDSRPRGHEMFGSCQQGISATFDKDYHYLIFGAPGAYNWKGVVRLEQKNDTLLEKGIYDDGPFETGDESQKDPELVPAPPNSYLGFSLDSSKALTKKDELIVVAGAPRAYHSGAVVFLKRGAESSNIMLEEHTLEGEGLASSFGYDLTLLDLNGDGWQDLVVGAPQYFEKDGEIGGAVYVYINEAGKWSKVKPTRIDGTENSMFGLAVENLGDINLDGYQDFAVGAPYDDDNSGKVYIYGGSKSDFSFKKPTQVLSGQPLGITLFGYSLAGNMDLDKNSYPDLAVGSLSDAVFVYKTRPVIHIKKDVKFTPEKIDFTNMNCAKGICLDVEACFTYSAKPKSYSPELTIAFSLEADSDHRKPGLNSRAVFSDSSSDKNYESKGVMILKKGERMCQTRQLSIPGTIKDKLHGIPIDVSVDIQEAKRKRRQSAAPLTPVLDANEPSSHRAVVQFSKKGCGDDNLCQSNLQLTYRYGHRSTDEGTFVPLKLDNGMPLISLSSQKDIALEVKVTNLNGDEAHEASLAATFPRSLTYSEYHIHIAPSERRVSCIANKDGSKLECELGNPFKSNSEVIIYIILGTAGISFNNTELEIDLQLKTTSEQKNIAPVKAKAKVAIQLQLSVSGQIQPSQVYFSGKVKGEAAMKTENDIGSAITHQFRIINLGKRLKDFGSAELNIRWPKAIEKGKWLLYLMKISSTGVEQMACTPKSEINSLGLEPSRTRSRRSATAPSGSGEGTIARYESKQSLTLSCENGARCVTIKCPLRGMDSNAVVTLHSRLWNGTFIEEYSSFHHVEVIVKASLHIDSTAKNTFLSNAETQVKMTVFPETRASSQYGGVSWWVILLSILLLLLLLGLLAFLLWKCGVFGKKNKEDPPEKKTLTSNA